MILARGPRNKESILQKFLNGNKGSDYDMIKMAAKEDSRNYWYGVQLVYNKLKWELVAGPTEFEARASGVRGRPCVSGLFRGRAEAKVGMVTSCHLDHCG